MALAKEMGARPPAARRGVAGLSRTPSQSPSERPTISFMISFAPP